MVIFIHLCLIISLVIGAESSENDDTALYYYGLEESERGLPSCAERQACAVLAERYWRPRALLRLCRCGPRLRCDSPAPTDRLIELNNRAFLQFCKTTTDWPECTTNDTPLTVETTYERMNPDEIESLHRERKPLTPPKIVLGCRCRHPNYWMLEKDRATNSTYRCSSPPICKSGDFCGNVDNDSLGLYQSCLCPKNHICVHNGGISHIQISELLYRGKGWRAVCQPISDDFIYDY